MQPPINILNEGTAFDRNNVGRLIRHIYEELGKIKSGQSLTTVISSAVSSAVSGGSSAKVEYRTGSKSVSAGSETITFSSALSTTDYKVIAWLEDSEGATTLLKSPTTKSLTGFTYTIDFTSTLHYVAIANQ